MGPALQWWRKLSFRAKLGLGLSALIIAEVSAGFLFSTVFASDLIQTFAVGRLSDSARAVAASEKSMVDALARRLQELSRQPRFKAVIKLQDRATLRALLEELRVENRFAGFYFKRFEGGDVVSTVEVPLVGQPELVPFCEALAEAAANVPAASNWASLAGRALVFVAIPVEPDGLGGGVLIAGQTITASELSALRDVAGADLVILSSGKVLAHSLEANADPLEIAQTVTASRAPKSGGAEIGISKISGRDYFVSDQWLHFGRAEGGVSCSILVGAASYVAARQKLIWQEGSVQIVILIFSVVLLLVMTHWLTRHFRLLLTATGKLADGEMQHRLKVSSRDEFGRLAAAFNTMAGRIEESQLMLAKANANLEHQVERRTISLSEEIKRRQAAEAELRAYSDSLESRVRERTAEIQKALRMLDRMQDAVFVFQANGVGFEYANQGAVIQLDRAREEIMALAPASILQPAGSETFGELLERVKQIAPKSLQFRSDLKRRDGTNLPVEISLQAVAGEGAEMSFVCIARDISERLMLQNRINRSQRLESIGTLAGGIAHDLNNALAPIVMSISMLRPQTPAETSVVQIISRCTNRAADLIKQLLTFARGTEGNKAEVRPEESCDQVAELARRTFPKNIAVRVAFDPSPWRVLADPTHVHQVVMNLAVNARDAMPDGGTLSLSVRNVTLDATFAAGFNEAQPGNYVEISVRDTGSGMSQEVQDRIFEPFFTTKPQGKGTGLGLSTSIGIVRSLGGFMHVQSKPTEGSTFFVYFPALVSGTAAAAPEQTAAPLWRGKGETALVIDDEDAVRTIYESVLRDLGYAPLVTAGAREALAAARDQGGKIAVVICDWQMPEMNGSLLVPELRPLLPQARFIIASGTLEVKERAKEFRGLKVEGYLQKPFSQTQLAECLNCVLGRSAPSVASAQE